MQYANLLLGASVTADSACSAAPTAALTDGAFQTAKPSGSQFYYAADTSYYTACGASGDSITLETAKEVRLKDVRVWNRCDLLGGEGSVGLQIEIETSAGWLPCGKPSTLEDATCNLAQGPELQFWQRS